MSLFDYIGHKYAKGAADWWNAKAGPPQPKKDDARGLVLPGYKYLGPGNGLDKGEPVNKADAAAREHDKAYDEQLKAGDNPYVKYNHADKEFQEALKDDTSFGGNLAKGVFQAKKRLLEPLGLVEDDKTGPVKRPRISTSQDSGIGSSQVSNASEHEFDPEEIDRIEAANAGASGTGNTEAAGVGSGTMSGGGGAPMGDNQQGADGVGTSSGNWHCDSEWLGDRVITRSTRTWALPSYNNNLYRQISRTASPSGNAYFGYSTPWGYFDFNRFHCHFSPRDWQRLVNNNWGFRPKRMHVKIFNIQVKEVTTDSGTTTVTNNLTSTIQVFTDDEYQLPYVCGNATEGCLPAFPPQVFTLPQYGYATLNKNTPTLSDPTNRSSFFCLEYFPSKMLRTGNNFDYSFDFEEVPFHVGWAPSQHLMRLANPLVDQYLYQFQSTTALGVPQYAKSLAGNYATQYKNWLPGACRRTQGWNVESNTTNNRANVTANSVANNVQIGNELFESKPEPNGMTNTLSDSGVVALDNSIIFNVTPTAPGTSAPVNRSAVLITREEETEPVNIYAASRGSSVASGNQTVSTAPTTEVINEQGVYPGSVWMERDVYIHGPIWAKIPNTGAHFHPSPMMGGFGLKNPPPMLFARNTPVPGPVTGFSEIPIQDFVTQYSTGQVTVSIEWELMKENSKRWNPETQYTNNYGAQDFIDFAPDSAGVYKTTKSFGTRWLTRPL